MKALTLNGNLQVMNLDSPLPAPGDALIRVIYAGICGTDREILKGYSGFTGIPGHEFVGEVVECTDSNIAGRHVVGEINVICGQCSWCLKGLGRHCPNRTVMGIVNRPGCFAEYVTLPVRNLHAVPEEVPDETAVFTEPLAAAAEILEQMQFAPGTPVAVIGDGRLGLLVAQVLQQAGAEVTVAGKHGWKMDLARSWGIRTHNLAGSSLRAQGFTVVVEASGSPGGLDEALRLVEPHGTVVMKSTFHDLGHFDTAKLVVDEITLLGSRCGNMAVALDLLKNHRVNVQHLVSKIFPLEEGPEAFDYLNHSSCLKVLLKM
jgi:2-desacetyl-2-hydroxyethyl bacteriochlorophyllide A dehydrogenase